MAKNRNYFIKPTRYQIKNTSSGLEKEPIIIDLKKDLITKIDEIEKEWSNDRSFFNDKYVLINFDTIPKNFKDEKSPARAYVNHGETIKLYFKEQLDMNKSISEHLLKIMQIMSQYPISFITKRFAFEFTTDFGTSKLLRLTDIIEASKIETYVKNSGAEFKIGELYKFREGNKNIPAITIEVPARRKGFYHNITLKNMPLKKIKGYLDLFQMNITPESSSAVSRSSQHQKRDSFYPQQILAIKLAMQKHKLEYLKKLFSIPQVSQQLTNIYDIYKNHTIISNINTDKDETAAIVSIDNLLILITSQAENKKEKNIFDSIDRKGNPIKQQDLIFELFYKKGMGRKTIYGFYDCNNIEVYTDPEKQRNLRP